MVREEEKQLIRECIHALREGIPGFKSRRPQMEMIAAVANTLSRCRAEDEQAGNGDHLVIVEAGTGTGKSFGALVPALVIARHGSAAQQREWLPGVADGSRFYFVHSYYMAPADAALSLGYAEYPFAFSAVIGRDNVFATQFHPEKSAAAGLKLLENFIAWDGQR